VAVRTRGLLVHLRAGAAVVGAVALSMVVHLQAVAVVRHMVEVMGVTARFTIDCR
jgi:hypothetical protein